jgi:dolichol-phosphate mannosyltransferase
VKSVVIIPTYNERDNVVTIIEAVMQLPSSIDVLIVDDGSPDGTADLVRGIQPKFPNRIFLEVRTGKLGLGTAYIHGFKWGLRNGYDFICEMDADFSHPPHKLIDLITTCKNGVDLAIGSRYIEQGGVVNWPKSRVFLSKGASLYTRIITFMPIKDPTAGFVCYTNKLLSTINFDQIKFTGYAFQIEMKFAAWKLGFAIREIPIIFTDRKYGVSKMNKGIIKEGIWGVLQLRWQSFFKSYRKRLAQPHEALEVIEMGEQKAMV